MNWGDFKVLVDDELTVNAKRRGIESFRDRTLRNAVLDLQRYIRPYRKGHTTTYLTTDLTVMTRAMLGSFPAGAKPEAFYIYQFAAPVGQTTPDPNCRRNRLEFTNWWDRQSLICGHCNGRTYGYAISPSGTQFLIHPALNDETKLLLIWDGLKQDFADGDVVPWPPEAAEACASYMMGKITKIIDKNPVLGESFMQDYGHKRLALFRDAQETQDAEKPDDEYVDSPTTPPDPLLANFGAEQAVFLRSITMLVGTTTAALAAVPTTGRPVPFLVDILDPAGSGAIQHWMTTNYIGQSGAGTLLPNDHDAATNNVIFIQYG